MDRFDADMAMFNRMCVEYNIEDAMALCFSQCHHYRSDNAEKEDANLRDARADMLTKCILIAETTECLSTDKTKELYALLEQRVCTWLSEDGTAELHSSVWLTNHNRKAFDDGFDFNPPKQFCQYFRECLHDTGLKSEQLEWLCIRRAQINKELWKRVHAVMQEDHLRVGGRVISHNLIDKRYDEVKCTLIRRHKDRWVVVFDGVSEPKAVRDTNLREACPSGFICAEKWPDLMKYVSGHACIKGE